MSKDKILDKIKKLLALGTSSNEHEAQSALLKARKLMAEHKLSESDIDIKPESKVETMGTGVDYSTRKRNFWTVKLAKVIATKHCCVHYVMSHYKSSKREVYFNGFIEDLEICVKVYQYAVDCVEAELKRIEKKFKSSTRIEYSKEYIDQLKTSYAEGFISGLDALYHEQDAELGWGLVMQTPEQVKQTVESMNTIKLKGRKALENSNAYNSGFKDGKNFRLNKRLN